MWLQIGIAVLVLGTIVVTAVVGGSGRDSLQQFLRNGLFPAQLLLPVASILLIAGEWSQRTTLVTFALIPRRGRVLAAKLLAVVTLACGWLVACGLFGVLVTAVTGSAWTCSAAFAGQAAVALIVPVLMGAAFGAALLVTPAAIVANFAIPVAIGTAGQLSSAIGKVCSWLSSSDTLNPLLTQQTLSGNEWARVGVTAVVWVALPLAVGCWRVLRGEIH
jgi:hypothetical protein